MLYYRKMPAKDNYHDTVVHALVRSGWTITDEQVTLVLPERRLWIDIEAEKASESMIILVEVKGFENPSQVEYFASAIGKYFIYIVALEWLKEEKPLYLAVPVDAYEGILKETLGQGVIQKIDLKLLVFDPLTEEVVQWIG